MSGICPQAFPPTLAGRQRKHRPKRHEARGRSPGLRGVATDAANCREAGLPAVMGRSGVLGLGYRMSMVS